MIDRMTDYLTCGQCLKEFPLQKITLFIQHKKLGCDDEDDSTISDPELQCNLCPQGFMTAWGLLIHAQISHNLKLFLERASRNLLKETKIYPENSSHDKNFLLPKTFLTTPVKAITDYPSETNTIFTTNISPSLEHSQLQVNKIGEQLFQPKDGAMQFAGSVGNFPRFGSSITVTRDLNSGVKEVMGQIPAERTGNQSAASFVYGTEVVENTTTSSTVADDGTERIQDLNQEPGDQHTPMVTESTETRQSSQEDPQSEHGLDNKRSDDCSAGKDVEKFVTGHKLIDTAIEGTVTQLSASTELSESSSECCDNQGCGITVIPGTHQDLQKCCNAVVPKKRKRHMEMKHMSLSWSSSRYGRRRLINRSLSNMKSMASANLAKASSIYIEVEPDSAMLDKQTDNNNDERDHESTVGFNITSETLTSASQVSTSDVPVQALSGAEAKPRSLILKPGAVFSIPFTYTIPVTSSLSALRFNKPMMTSSLSQKTPVLAASLSHHGNPRETSQLHTAVKLPQTTLPDNDSDQKREKVTDLRRRPPSKPFPCETCSMTFNQRIHLKKHVMSKHTGNKPYKCGECDYSTVERSHLKVHIRIHTGEKPFKCTYCEYATAQNSTLKIHLKRHHGGKMFHCASCEKEFTQEQQLRGHDCEHVGVTGPDRKSTLQSSTSAGPQTTADLPAETAQPLEPESALPVDRVDNSTNDESSQVSITSLPGLQSTQMTESDLKETNGQDSP